MAGDFITTKKILDSIDFSPNNRYYSMLAIAYFNIFFDCYLNLGDIENAKKMQVKLKEALEDDKLNKTLRDKFYYHYLASFYNLNIASGDYNGAIEFLHIEFNRLPKLLNKVEVQFQIGKVLFYSKEMEQARKAFDYVIGNGGSTFYVKEAKELLSQI